MKWRPSPRDELIIGIAVVLLIAVLVVIFLIMPNIQQRGALIAEQERIRQEVLTNQATLARLKEAQSESVANRAELIRVATEMPDQPELPTLIVEIQDLANQAGIDFISITPSPPAKSSGYDTIGLKMQTTGQFRDLVDFLSRLAALQRKVRVNAIDISVQKYPVLSLALDGQTFVMQALSPTATAPPPAAGG